MLSQICTGLHVKNPYLFLLDFNQTWFFSIRFRKTFKYQISWISVCLPAYY